MRKTKQTDRELLEALLQGQEGEPVRVEAGRVSPTPQRTPQHRRRASSGALDRLITTAALAAALFIVFQIWLFGARASLAFIGQVFDLSGWGLWVWAIPIGITLLEVHTAHLLTRPAWAIFYGVIVFIDVGTTAAGVYTELAGLTLPAGVYTLPTEGAELWLASFVIGGLAAFLAEPLARLALAELGAVWR